ncbi:MAG: NosD domain-containing protein [Zestosphaera sp.]
MDKERVLAILVIIAISMSAIVGLLKPVMSQSESTWVGRTIYIRADGSIEPSDAPIISSDNRTYIITSNIQIVNGDGIVIERDNVILEGGGHTIRGAACCSGILLTNRVNISIKNLVITNFTYGVYLKMSSGTTIKNNTINNNEIGIFMYYSSNNTIESNTISNSNWSGIYMSSSSSNSVLRNTLRNNYAGIAVWLKSQGNWFLYNNFVNNSIQVYLASEVGYNVWDDGFVGNYWSDHYCVDSDSNGVCDDPYVIRYPDNVDRYPSAYPYPFEVVAGAVESLIVFVRATGGDVWFGLVSENGSVDWRPLGGIVVDAPSAVFYNGSIYVFVRDSGGGLWYGLVNPVDWSFSGWIPLQGLAGSRPSVVATDYGVVLAVRDFNGGLWIGLFNGSSVNWVSIPGVTIDSPAAAYLDGELHLVVRGLDGYTIWHGVVELPDLSFRGWSQVSGLTNSTPELLVVGDTLYLAVRDLGNGVALATYNKLVGWLGWLFIPGGLTDTQPSLAYFNGELVVAVKALNDQSIWLARKNHGYWSWINIPGLTTHEPELICVRYA